MKTKQAALIDPVVEMVGRDLKLVNELGFTLRYAGMYVTLALTSHSSHSRTRPIAAQTEWQGGSV